MTIDELVSQEGIDNIQKRTRISKENIKKIISKDFGNLNRAKLYGFLSILEREYGPIDDLRRLYEEYNEKNTEKVNLSNDTSRKFSVNSKPNLLNLKLILYIGGLLVLCFIAFKAFYTDDKSNMQIPKIVVDLNDTNQTLELNDTNKTVISNTINNKDINSTDLNLTNTNHDKNITKTTKEQHPNHIVKKDTIDKSYNIDDNMSKTITKTKLKYKNHKNDYLKVEDDNKSQENNL